MPNETYYYATGSEITSIADAIREKSGTNTQLEFPDDFVEAINNISGSGGSIVISDEPNLTGMTAVVTASNVTSQHSIYFEFSDQTNTTIPVYYNDASLSAMITAYKPTTYGQKTVTLAQLDGVTWYEPANIPIGVELIDYTKLTSEVYIGEDGATHSNQWSYTSDYTEVDPSMTFSYTGYYWYYVGVYDENKNVLRTIYSMNDATVDPNDGNTGHGTLSGNKLLGAKYVRICGAAGASQYLSLIRTA